MLRVVLAFACTGYASTAAPAQTSEPVPLITGKRITPRGTHTDAGRRSGLRYAAEDDD